MELTSVAGLAIASLILSVISIIIGILSLIALVGFMRSTHKVQYVPLDPSINDAPEEHIDDLEQMTEDLM
jgi:hypothetical protein